MARPGFSLDRKFKRLARTLDGHMQGLGDILARGALELLWDSAYEATDEYLGDAVDVEALAGWRGAGGVLVAALLDAGGDGKAGFIEEGGSPWWADGKAGTYRVHDLWDHAPDYARKRLERETEREAKGQTIKDIRAAAGRKGAAATNAKRTATEQPTSGKRTPLAGQAAASVRQDARTLAPTLAPAPEEAAAAAPASAPAPEQPRPPARRRAAPAADDLPPAPRLLLVDHRELGPLGAEWRGRLEVELGRGLSAPAEDKRAEVAAEIETLLEHEDGVERAVAWVANTARARRRSGGGEPASVTGCLLILRAMPRRDPDPIASARASCPAWAELLEALERLPLADRPTEHQVERWLQPLRADFARGVLALEAPDEVHRAFVEGEYLAGLQRLAGDVLGPHVVVQLAPAAPVAAAAGGAA